MNALVILESLIGEIDNVFVEDLAVPRGFQLTQNFPNPFNPTTTISLALPYVCHVILNIYNISGQRVKTLVDEVRPAGNYSIVWDGTNDAGNRVTSGLYIYRIETDGFSQSKKLMLMK